MAEPGVYRSDVEGHLLVLKMNPVSVTCVVCVETCSRAQYKTLLEFRPAAAAFVGKHGALDERIADNILQLVPGASIKGHGENLPKVQK
jgi:hypothetical protein